MTEAQQPLFDLLRQFADPGVVDGVEQLVRDASDRELVGINPLAFAAKRGLDEEQTIGAFLHATRIGLFELNWNVVCPGCSGILRSGGSLKTIDRGSYKCAMCSLDCEPILDGKVEVTFTISPRVRKIAAHEPDNLSMWDYARQIFWSSRIELPDDLAAAAEDAMLDAAELPAGERAILSLQVPEGTVIVFDSVTHTSQILKVSGEPSRERQSLTVVFDDGHTHNEALTLRPGLLRLSLENKTSRRILPTLWILGDALHKLVGRRVPFLSAKRLLTHQTFRDIFRTDVLDIKQRLKITSLTFMFTDLKGSTGLYERVGDLAAYEFVQAHFGVLADIIADEAGAVVKTIGDAVMATFATPEHALAAAMRIREAMETLNAQHGHEDMLLKIGIHEGPCLAVMLNERQDYFGQTVNIASRVQNLAGSRTILITGPVAEDDLARKLIEKRGLTPSYQITALRGVQKEVSIYEIH
jgi:class 3 adenylate cyclase